MKAYAMLRTVILASTMAFGVSCKTPLLEGPPPLARLSHYNTVKPHPCVKKIIEGGKPSCCHIILQKHEDVITGKTSREIVRSQLFQYHLLSDLIENYGVSVILFDGIRSSADVGESIRSTYGEKHINEIQATFASCVDDAAQTIRGLRKTTHARFHGLITKRAVEDFCFAKALWRDYKFRDLHHFLLIVHNPSVLFTGFEKDKKTSVPQLKKHKLLWRLSKIIGPFFGSPFEKAFEDFFKSRLKEWLMRIRGKHIAKEAVKEIALYSTRNTALVIGAGHMDHIIETIETIPSYRRPTFYFVMPECQDNPAFYVSSDVIELAKAKQNL